MKLKFLIVSLALGMMHLGAAATDVNLHAAQLAASCANCHGTNGVSVGGSIPGLAGKSKQTIITMMQDFKTGARQATLMHQLAKGYTDEQIALMAEFFAQQAATAGK